MPVWWSDPTPYHAYILSLVSLVLTLIAAIGGVVGYLKLDDSLILIYGLENIVDFFSSAIVLWRFNTPSTSAPMNDTEQQQHQQQTEILANREKRASIGVSIILGVLGLGGLITAIDDLASGIGNVEARDLYTVYYLSFASFAISGILAKFKFHYATALKSPSLRKDGICSLIGSILGFAMFFNAVLTMVSSDEMWWWLDPVVALLCGIGALVYGLYGMYKAYVKDGYPIFSCSWWLYNSGMENDQHTSRVGGGLELQQSSPSPSGEESMMGNPSMNDPSVSTVGMYPTNSQTGDGEMSDIVIT
jgi:hypothetical protein